MRTRPSPVRLLFAALAFAPALAAAGCGNGQPVRESRSVNFSAKGDQVAFQHGGDGVYVTDPATGQPRKIFAPGPDVLATSPPLWSGDDRRLLFTAARAADGAAARPAGDDPAGAAFRRRAVVYTCYQYEVPKGDEKAEPVALFEAACDHVGYVAANLAVRWHPDGGRVLFVKRTDGPKHGLFEYDLKSKATREVFPHAAEALTFEWAPDNARLAVVVGNDKGGEHDGVWVGRPGGDWWHVPGSGRLAEGALPSLLEQVRATQPAWTRDAARFAFAAHEPGAAADSPGRHFLHVADPAARAVKVVAEGSLPYRDLFWSPQGDRLGYLAAGKDTGTLYVLPDGGEPKALTDRPVRQFAGWNAAGDRLAYVVPDDLPPAGAEPWAFLLTPDPLARDAVYVADGAGAGKQVFSGMRVTFPRWSPKEDKLSVWFTFCPTYHSWLSRLVGAQLRPGDPAAVFDAKTGQVSWLAVNGYEKAQVGHYHLLKRDYAGALRWYEEAAGEPPGSSRRTGPAAREQVFQHLTSPRDASFFHAYCLHKLGKADEAEAKWRHFEENFLPRPDDLPGDDNRPLRELLDPRGLAAWLLRDLYAAEAYFSLDAAEDAEAYFRDRLASARGPARLSHALVLAQVLLVEGKHRAYADLAADVLVPELLAAWEASGKSRETNLERPDSLLLPAGGLCLLPLFHADFLKGLPADQVRGLLAKWQKLDAKDDVGRLGVDLFLEAAHRRLGDDAGATAAADRVAKNPARAEVLGDRDVAAAVRDVRAALALFGK